MALLVARRTRLSIRLVATLPLAFITLGGCTPDRPLTVYVIDCGRIRFASPAPFGVSDSETDIRELSVPCYVVEHPAGTLLWEAGMPTHLAGQGWTDPPPRTIAASGVQVRLDRPLSESLTGLGLDLGSFDYVAVSHMHFDHVGAVNELTSTTFLTARAEFDAALADSVTVPLFNPDYYAAIQSSERIILDGEHDVFGDGRIRILPAPGHTPGHQVLLVHLEETGPIILAGDLYFFEIGRELRRIPLFNVDAEGTRRSMDRIEALAAETGAEVWIEHDAEQFDALRKSPIPYR